MKMTYKEFIQSIKESRENKWFKYSERHHIVPRCVGGTDDEENLIYLTYQEHFIAHKLLHKEHPESRDLLLPIMFYMKGNPDMTPDEYASIRREFIDSQKGENNPMYGKTWRQSPEAIARLSDSMKKYKKTPEHCKHISEGRKGKCLGDNNPMRNPETAAKISEILSGENNPMYGKTGENHPLYGSHFTWMTNGIDNKRATDDMISALESQGYYRGYTQKFNNSEEARQKRKAGRSKVEYHRICKLCGREFISKSGNAKYCGCHLTR
jgi:hypothetical protein